MAKIVLIFGILLAVCFCLISAAPSPQEILDAHSIIQKITAEYEKLGGESHHHPEEIADVIDAHNFHLNI